ncbi:MAG TPA: isoprenylcysteine carboxylmethyltransferase family protein, partial [Acidobacteriota bacterium]|nr:isoprenylcysteine carboxylmethyltransferase family protein [Acidobacteriota bacterium]
ILGEGLRAASMRALGDRWTARVLVVPGEPRVRAGVYRRLAHPNYLGAALELAAVALLFGAWRTALLATAANALLLAFRARVESAALAAAEREAPSRPPSDPPPGPGSH